MRRLEEWLLREASEEDENGILASKGENIEIDSKDKNGKTSEQTWIVNKSKSLCLRLESKGIS